MKDRNKAELELLDQRQSATMRMFHDVARALTSTLELQPLLEIIMTKMADIFGPERWSLMLVDEEACDLYYVLSAGIQTGRMETLRIPIGEGMVGWVAETGTPLVIPDVRKDAHWSRFAADRPELKLRSIACIPIRSDDRTLGVIQLQNSALDLMPEYTLSFLRILCDYAAIALRNARDVKMIHHLSITDDCTGLFNARYLYSMLEAQIAETTDPHVVPIQQHFSLVFLDLDRFKTINDTYGHLVGSRLLAEVGGLLKREIGPQHAAFRYGGDEFVLLLRGLDTADATTMLRTVRERLIEARFLTGEDLAIPVTGSFGLATFPQHGTSLHGIIRSADAMMYRVKQATRNGIEVATAPVDTEAPAASASAERIRPNRAEA